MGRMKILVIGGGGREHALCWKLGQSALVTQVFCAPGNAGIAEHAECIALDPTDIPKLLEFAQAQNIDLTVVGPEAPLAAGLVDAFVDAELKVFGPTQSAAQLESSKAYSKQLMNEARIPTARFAAFTELAPALEYVQAHNLPVVIKQDGLAAGKGVVIAHSLDEAQSTVRSFLGAAGASIVIEEFLDGEELSCIAIANAEDFVLLAASQDHKQIGEGDTGANTGGMGAYSPVDLWSEALETRVKQEVIIPTLQCMRERGAPFRGFLYVGLMIVDGTPYVLEYNVRFGDPEAQAVLARLESDFADLLLRASQGEALPEALQWSTDTSLCVVMASGGYPGSYTKGHRITGLDDSTDDLVFHAGTKQVGDQVVTAGGRVLGVTALGADIHSARANAYRTVDNISWEGCYVRRDIGCRHDSQYRTVKDAS